MGKRKQINTKRKRKQEMSGELMNSKKTRGGIGAGESTLNEWKQELEEKMRPGMEGYGDG